MKSSKNKENHKKNTINKLISAPNNHQHTIVEYFIASVIQFDNPFYLMVLFNNYLICIFMNINENLKNKGNHKKYHK